MRLRGRYLIFALLSLVAIAITAEAEEVSNGAIAISANRDSSDDIKGKTSELNPYKPTYIILQAGTPDPRSKNIIFTKFQINIKLPVAEPLFFAYTLKALWDITEDSAPFKDYSHNPEFFLDIDNSNMLKIGQIGVEHESNGKSGEDSRSWNRVYWEPRFVYKRPAGKILGFDTVAVHLKGWYKIEGDQSGNPDILDYYGNGELTIKLYGNRGYLAVKTHKGLKKAYGNIQVEFIHRISESLGIYAQFWDGYGESLLDYNKGTTRYGIGFALTK